MPTPKTPPPPVALGTAGRAIWDSALDRFDVTEEERAVLLSTCQTADLVATLQADVDAVGPIVDGRPNPLLAELRQQRIVLTRLVASLRIPDEDDAPRPQRRGGARGSYSTGVAR